jgi:hypothetical protein
MQNISHLVEMPSLHDALQERLPIRLADALTRLEGIIHSSLMLGNFVDGQADEFAEGMSVQQIIWPQLHSLRIKAPKQVLKSVIEHCDLNILRTISLYAWYNSEEFLELKRVKRLDRLRLQYENEEWAADHDFYPCCSKALWRELWTLWKDTRKRLKVLILFETPNKCADNLRRLQNEARYVSTVNYCY